MRIILVLILLLSAPVCRAATFDYYGISSASTAETLRKQFPESTFNSSGGRFLGNDVRGPLNTLGFRQVGDNIRVQLSFENNDRSIRSETWLESHYLRHPDCIEVLSVLQEKYGVGKRRDGLYGERIEWIQHDWEQDGDHMQLSCYSPGSGYYLASSLSFWNENRVAELKHEEHDDVISFVQPSKGRVITVEVRTVDPGEEAYKDGDFEKAYKHWRHLAGYGDPESQYQLGNLYVKGLWVKKDEKEAARLFKLAAERGHPQAQLVLGEYYFRGTVVPQSYEKAYAWWLLAADHREEAARENMEMARKVMPSNDIYKAYKLAEKWRLKNKK